jgi:hypothetical protein
MALMGWISSAETVIAPDERAWTVRRVLLPRPPRWRGKSKANTDWGSIDYGMAVDGAINGPTALVVGIIVFFLLLLSWAFLIPTLFFLLDLLIVLSITLVSGAVRVLFRRPWRIEARTGGRVGEQHSWGVVGVRASADAVDHVAFAIARGERPEDIRLDR